MAQITLSTSFKILIATFFILSSYSLQSSQSEWDQEEHPQLLLQPIQHQNATTTKISKDPKSPSSKKSELSQENYAIDAPISVPDLIAEDDAHLAQNGSPDDATATDNETENKDDAENIREKTILVNFNNVHIVEFIRYLSKISNKNFYFNEQELDFNITIISEDYTSIENVLTALLQELRIHEFDMIELGDNIIIHSNSATRAPGTIKAESLPETLNKDADIVTQVFRLNTANATNVSKMILPILSQNAIVEVLEDTNHIIVTDFNGNVKKIAELIKGIDAPNSSLIIGQYVVRSAFMDTLIANAELIMQSVAPGQAITFVAHAPSNSVFIVSTPFLVERAIPILQRLDQTDGITGIYNLNELKYVPRELMKPGEILGPEGVMGPGGQRATYETGPNGELILRPSSTYPGGPGGPGGPGTSGGVAGAYPGQYYGSWKLDKNGNWFYDPQENNNGGFTGTTPPEGSWSQDLQGNWQFTPGTTYGAVTPESTPKGYWEQGADGKWRFLLTPGESIFANKKVRAPLPSEELPLGHIERTKFLIHKLNYRLGDSIEAAMLKIADSLRLTNTVNQDLVATINSVQWLEASNAMIFTGNPESLLKVKELIEEIDQPLRQVFIEMLILDTSIDDSLNYSVNMGSKFRENDGDLAGIQAFQSGASTLGSVLASAGVAGNTFGGLTPRLPDPNPFIANQGGYNTGIIGQKICLGGLEFNSLAALVRAVHSKTDTNIIMNPKILTEDNVTAEIFVGLNTQFKTQSISNDQGSILTNNFEFRDVGTTLRVTPLLGPSNIITLQIEEEVSNIATGAGAGGELVDVGSGPTTRINRTSTQVHIPDNFFLVISGMMQDQLDSTRDHVPCLGGVPILGAAFTGKSYRDQKRCLMIFIRPQLIDTERQIDRLTEHQQNIFRVKGRTKKMWKLDCEEALDWLNLKDTDITNDERKCCDLKY